MVDEKSVEDKKVDERRSFMGPDDITNYYVSPPSAEDIRGADWNYSKMYTKCLVEGITTSAEMMDILMRRGIIGPEFEQRTIELTAELNNKILALEKAVSIEEKRDSSIEVAMAREELFQWNQRLNGPMNNTCEQMSDDARLEHLTSCMVQTEDGKRVWDSYDSYLKEKRHSLAIRSRFEIMLYLQGLESDFLEQTPEAQAMREVQSEIMKKAEEAMKAVEALAQEEEELAKATEKPKKTTARKKVEPISKKTDQ
jgi:hypothetical protein